MRKYYFLIILLSVIPFLPILISSDLPHTHDGLVHLPRMAAFYKALADGQFPVRWAGDLNYGYGMPLFNFVYHLPYYISSIFILFGAGLVLAFKLTIILSFVLSGVFMLLFSKEFFKDPKTAFLVTIFYQFVSFRFVELLIRGSFGEVYTYTFLPLMMFALYKLFKKYSVGIFGLASFSTALLIISHNSVSLLFFGVASLFILFFAKSKRNILLGFAALGVGLLLSAYYWVPAIADHKYTYGNLFMKEIYLAHFVPIYQFFIPNITNNKILQTEGITTQFGLFHTLALIGGIVMFVRQLMNRPSKTRHSGKRSVSRIEAEKDSGQARMTLYCLVLTVGAMVFMFPVSGVFWKNISLLRQFQFPWRFLSITVFSTSMLASSFLFVKIFKNTYAYSLLIVLVIASTAYFWFPNLGYDKVDERYYWNFPLSTTYYGETDVIWSAGPAKSYPKNRVEVISGKASIADFVKYSDQHTFSIQAPSDVAFVSHTQYFPGWRVYVDNAEITNVQFQDPNHRGEIVFTVPKGNHAVSLKFEETKIRLIADMISLVTAVILLGVVFVKDGPLLKVRP